MARASGFPGVNSVGLGWDGLLSGGGRKATKTSEKQQRLCKQTITLPWLQTTAVVAETLYLYLSGNIIVFTYEIIRMYTFCCAVFVYTQSLQFNADIKNNNTINQITSRPYIILLSILVYEMCFFPYDNIIRYKYF